MKNEKKLKIYEQFFESDSFPEDMEGWVILQGVYENEFRHRLEQISG